MVAPNELHEETERRLAALFSDVLSVLNRRSEGHYSYVEIVSTTELRLITRYITADSVEHEITQSVNLNYGTRVRP